MANIPSGSSTPNTRFASQGYTAEDVLKEQTVGLVQLSDFKKRRAEALEQLSRDATPSASGATTPDGRESASNPAAFKKRKKIAKKGGLSFGNDDEGDAEGRESKDRVPAVPSRDDVPPQETSVDADEAPEVILQKRLKPNSAVSFQPKALTKTALAREAVLKEKLRKEYAQIQEAVKQTDFCLPFVFFDGKNAPGGVCRMKKGDFVWLFLDKARKVGAAKGGGMKDWARIGIDDLMLVKGQMVVPHHYDFHYFIVNKTKGYDNQLLFAHAAEPTSATPKELLPTTDSPSSTPQPEDAHAKSLLMTAADRVSASKTAAAERIPDSELEGFHDDPSQLKVVDRRWYEKNKHIYPASMWEEFDPEKDYSQGARKDANGNAFFFSSR